VKITKITNCKLHIPGRRGSLSKTCEESADNPLFSNVKVGSVSCTDLCPMFLAMIGKFIICKGKRK
jgi:hypothetical protein